MESLMAEFDTTAAETSRVSTAVESTSLNEQNNRVVYPSENDESRTLAFERQENEKDSGQRGSYEQFLTKLRICFYKNGVTRTAQNSILNIVKEHFNADYLPKTGMALMKTIRCPRSFIMPATDGEMHYVGIKKGLMTVITDSYLQNRAIITLDFFWDGLSPHKSSKTHLWPLLGRIARTESNKCSAPFLVNVFCSNIVSKPDPHEFMSEFVKEAKSALSDGLDINGKTYFIKIDKLIGDQPARALVTCTNGEGARSFVQCDRCEIVGKTRIATTVFPMRRCLAAALRTDKSFREKRQAEYHIGDSPLLALDIDMIFSFPLDPMHLLYSAGVVKRWLEFMITRRYASKYKIYPAVTISMSNFMETYLKGKFPRCFSRRLKGVEHIGMYKAVDWRRFLLYDGVVVIKKYAQQRLYMNFLLLFCAIRILSSEEHVSNDAMLRDAETLLRLFLEDAEKELDKTFVCIKPHQLTHLVDDCRKWGVLENFSAFPFESYLRHIKCLMRSGGKCLEQLIRRLSEAESIRNIEPEDIKTEDVKPPCGTVLLKIHARGPLIGNATVRQYNVAFFRNGMTVRLTDGDSCFQTIKGELIKVLNIVVDDEEGVRLVGKRFIVDGDYFSYPFKSSLIGVLLLRSLERSLHYWQPADLKCKYVVLPLDEEECQNVGLPLLHADNKDSMYDSTRFH